MFNAYWKPLDRTENKTDHQPILLTLTGLKMYLFNFFIDGAIIFQNYLSKKYSGTKN
jgi:hypothetical protein